MSDQRVTEQASHYQDLEQQSARQLISWMNAEDLKVAEAVEKVLPAIERLIEAARKCMQEGGRLFYIGAGTSGRLGVLDASECPPTFGVPSDWVNGVIAGGDFALRNAIEGAEDDAEQGLQDLLNAGVTTGDFVIGLSASGTAPYVLGALKQARAAQILTGCICCNTGTIIGQQVHYPVEVATGPEFVTGSTRLKAGTAQKMILNMISTVCMIQMGRVEGNEMIYVQFTNQKLIDRAIRIVIEKTGDQNVAKVRETLIREGTVKKAIEALKDR